MTEENLRKTLEARFSPIYLQLTDESHKHVGHPETMKEREKLLDLVLVSASFEGQSLLERHAAVYAVLDIGKNAGIHGITIRAYSPAEWKNRQ